MSTDLAIPAVKQGTRKGWRQAMTAAAMDARRTAIFEHY